MLAKLFTLLSLLLLAGCSSVPSLLYRIDVQQGNFITQEIVDKLNLGMTKSQVRFVLGSALISDPFHDNRWDYVYRLVQDGKLTEQRRLTVFFENDKLVPIQDIVFSKDNSWFKLFSKNISKKDQEIIATALKSQDLKFYTDMGFKK